MAATKRPSKQLIDTAYHEAGHAVIMAHHGWAIDNATIAPGDGYLGRVVYAKHRLQRVKRDLDILKFESVTLLIRERIEIHIMVLFAGEIAAKHRKGQKRTQWYGSDAYLFDMLLSLSGSEDEASAYGQWLYLRTHGLIRRHWPSIIRVADALLEKQTLTGDEVHQCMTTSLW